MATPASPSRLGELLAIARHHIVLIAMTGTLTFGWLITGRYLVGIALTVGLDWFLINLMNRITDIAEDRKNGIPGTERVARSSRLLALCSALLLVGSFAVTAVLWPALTPVRVAVQLIGLGYNYRIVPTPRGLSRFKEIYFLKNFGSAVLFILTCFVYPWVAGGRGGSLSPVGVGLLALYFLLFEHTYEILYDFRDLDGDRLLGVPTYPVVHGPAAARRLVAMLLVSSVLVITVGLLAGAIGVREGLMAVAPLSQWLFYRHRLDRGLTSRDCVLLTHLGTAQLALFLAGTALWQRAGLPSDIYLFGR